MISRRQLVQVSLAGSLFMGTSGCMFDQSIGENGVLSSSQVDLIKCLAPTMLGNELQDRDLLFKFIKDFSLTLSALPLPCQKEVGELLWLLTFPPTRCLVARVWQPWHQVTPEAATRFLENWRFSSVLLLRTGYQALHELIMATWYGQPQSWASIGYPGPPF